MPATHLTRDDRVVIETLFAEGYSRRAIGRRLGRAVSTISRELRRNGKPRKGFYEARAADVLARRRLRRRSRRLCDPPAYVAQRIRSAWSPDQIIGRWEAQEGREGERPPSRATLYRWLKRWPELKRYLRHGRKGKRKRRGSVDGRGVIAGRTMIDQRPSIVNDRGRIGDWEGDTMKSGSAHVAVFVERVSGYMVARRLKGRWTEAVVEAAWWLFAAFPRTAARTMTVDNGKEFARHGELAEATGSRIYFAHPGRPDQRGSCENAIGLLRQYLPKRYRGRVTQAMVDVAVTALNNRPRKRLGYRTPCEALQTEGVAL